MVAIRPSRPLDSAIIIPALVVFVLSICQACDQTTPVYQVGAPPEGTPTTSTEDRVAQSTPESAVYNVGALSEAAPVTSTEVQPAQPTPEPGFSLLHSTDFEDFLSGDTIGMYRNLPPEYQVALQAYSTWGIARDRVDVVVAQKIKQWPAEPTPMSDVLSPTGYQMYQDLHPKTKSYHQARFLLYSYPYVLATEQDADARRQALDRILEKMQPRVKQMASSSFKSAPGTPEFEEELDALMFKEREEREQPIRACLPPFEEMLVPEAVRRLDSLGPDLRQAFRDWWGGWEYNYDITGAIIKDSEVFLLKAPAGLELPPLEDILTEDMLQQVQSLSPDDQRDIRNRYIDRVLGFATGRATGDPNDTLPMNILESCECGGYEGLEATRNYLATFISSRYRAGGAEVEKADSVYTITSCSDRLERMERYRAYFQGLIDDLREEHSFTSDLSAEPQSGYQFESGYRSVYYSAVFTESENVRVALYIRPEKDWAKWAFDELIKTKDSLESELGENLVWERLDNRIYSQISVTRPGSIYDDPEMLEDINDWMIDLLLRFEQVFDPKLSELIKIQPIPGIFHGVLRD